MKHPSEQDFALSVDEQQLLALLQGMIRINSVNPYLDPEGNGERELAGYIGSVLEGMGLEVSYQELTDKAVNVIGILRGSGNGQSLLLNGHMDTVSSRNMSIEPLQPTFADGKVYGRGSCDMKGSLAAMIAAVQAIQQAGVALDGDVILTFVADEEYKSIGTEHLVKTLKADAAIVCEPSDLDMVVTHKGFAWVKVELFGKEANGSRPHEGVDAIVKAGKFLVELERLSARLREKQHPILGSPSVHASLISGGTELSTYPDYCAVEIERRTIPGETVADVEREMQEMLGKLASEDEQFRAEYEIFFVREPYEIDPGEPIAQALREAYVQRFQTAPRISGFSGWADSALIHGAGIPTVIFGPHGAGLHGAVEYVEWSSLVQMTHVLANTIVRFCKSNENQNAGAM